LSQKSRWDVLLPRLLNVGLRGMALVSRFVLLFFLARFLAPAEVGLFGLFLATTAFSVLIVGGDFYTFSHRELLSRPKSEWAFVIEHHLVAVALLYGVFLPAQLLLFQFDLLPPEMLLWFFSLLIVEHVTQELNRLLVVMQKPLLASWILFVRMGLWIWVVVPLMLFYPEYRNLQTLFFCWFVGAGLATCWGLVLIVRAVDGWCFFSLDWGWLRKGFQVSVLFLLATIALKLLFTVDRFVVEALVGENLLGVYVLYAGMAMAVFNFLDPAVFSFLYPRLVSAYRQQRFSEYKKIYRELFLSTLLVSGVLVLLVFVLAPWMLAWLDHEIYLEQLSLLWLLLVVVLVYALGMVPHYGLYALGGDREIMSAHLLAVGVFMAVVWVVAEAAPLTAVAWGLLAAFSVMGLFKAVRYRHLFGQAQPSLGVTIL